MWLFSFNIEYLPVGGATGRGCTSTADDSEQAARFRLNHGTLIIRNTFASDRATNISFLKQRLGCIFLCSMLRLHFLMMSQLCSVNNYVVSSLL